MSSTRPFLAFGFTLSLALAAAACGTTVQQTTADDHPTKSSQAAGAACAFDDQCATHLCSADPAQGQCGECVDILPLGAACGAPGKGCSRSAHCVNGACATLKKGPGEACMNGPKGEDVGDCDDELYCAHDGQGVQTGHCKERVPAGGTCVEAWDCVTGASCVQGVCALPPPGSCQWPLTCGEGDYCDSGVCKPATLALGATCGIVDGQFVEGDCAPGLVCGNADYPNGGAPQGAKSTCLPLPKTSAPCIEGACAPGNYCDDHFDGTNPLCVAQKAEGASCTRNMGLVQCAPGLECRADVCKPACK